MAYDLPNKAEDQRRLAQQPNFRLGDAIVKPSLRTLEGPVAAVVTEPRVMQVLVAIADADGGVVSRDDLMRICWDNRIVGDDAVNRAIAEVRRAARESGSSFGVETIPRIGYRLVGAARTSAQPAEMPTDAVPSFDRRHMIGGAVAAGAIAGVGGLALAVRARRDQHFGKLMQRGEQALLYNDPSVDAWPYFERAAALRPDHAAALGLFASARALRAEYEDSRDASLALLEAERSARAALAIDPGEPNARLALILLQRSMLDFATTEDRLRQILASAPGNTTVMKNLWNLLQSVGRSRDALILVQRANALEPLAASNQYPRAQLLWILGRTAEADRVIDRAMQYWPSHRFVRFARFTIYAFTGRAIAALAMLDDAKTRPQAFSAKAVALWQVSLAALDRRTPATIAAAREANTHAARQTPALTNQAVMVLSALGDIDAAFDIANGFLLGRGMTGAVRQRESGVPVKSTAWRFAPWLFTPPLAAFRADARFLNLCDGIGLTEYWTKRGIKPDYQLGIA